MCSASLMETDGYALRCRRALSAIADQSVLGCTTITLLSEEPTSFCLRVSWTSNGECRDIPQSLFVKIPRVLDATARRAFRREIEFYTQVAPRMDRNTVLASFLCGSDKPDNCFVALEDLSESHVSINRYDTPSDDQIIEMVRCLALIHGASWDHESLKKHCESGAAEQRIMFEFMRNAPDHFEEFLVRSGFTLDAEHRALMERLFDRLPALLIRRLVLQSGGAAPNLTLIHSDPHPGNFLRDRRANSLRIIDWQDWKVSFAAHDLVHLMISGLDEDRVRCRELEFLEFYLSFLPTGISDGFRIEQLFEDFCLATLRSLCVPIRHWAIGLPDRLWRLQLINGLATCDRLGCWSLLA